MFTIVPSLYLVGIQYFRLWRKSYYREERTKEISEINNNNTKEIPVDVQTSYEQQSISSTKIDNSEYISDASSERSHGSGIDRKRSSRRHRKRLTGELTQKDISYLIKHTGFTEENIRLWYQDFLRDCPDGKLSTLKFTEIYQQFYKKGRVTKFCHHAFRLFDKDGSGYIEFTEFLLAVSLTSSKDPVRKIELFFAMYDIDHNGLIDENEMRSVVESIYELMGIDVSDPSRIDSKVHEIFSKAECDSLGYLGKEQFAQACKNDRHIRKLLMPTTKSMND